MCAHVGGLNGIPKLLIVMIQHCCLPEDGGDRLVTVLEKVEIQGNSM
jgi:hypothetical protein